MNRKIQKHEGTFSYSGKEIPFIFYSHANPGGPPDTVIFLGSGQIGSIPRWVVEAAPAGVIAVQGVPHWEMQPTPEDVENFSGLYVQHAFCSALKTFGLKSAHLIAESQAVPGAVVLTAKLPELVRNLVLVRPLGFTVEAFGRSPEDRLDVFKRRVIRTNLQIVKSLLRDPRNAAIAITVARAMGLEPTRDALYKKYAAGISYDLREDCRCALAAQTRKGNELTFILAENDKVFPPCEIQATLSTAGISGANTIIVPGAWHSSLASRSSRETLRMAVETVRD